VDAIQDVVVVDPVEAVVVLAILNKFLYIILIEEI
jgi:hypothetical protein